MGRKIPGRKHRGVRDPEKQMAKRMADLSKKNNLPPKSTDDQDIPKSLVRIMKLKDAMKNNNMPMIKKRKKNKGVKLIRVGGPRLKSAMAKGRTEKAVPVFNQRPCESEYEFLERVNRETHNFVKETEFETKFNVDIKRCEETGEIEGIVKRQKLEIDELDNLVKKHNNISFKKLLEKIKVLKLRKSQKKKKHFLKKKNKLGEVDDFKQFTDKVEFGEVVHAPPELKIRPKKAGTADTKERTNSLLLSSMLRQNGPNQQNESKSFSKNKKWKELGVGERRQLKKQQAEAITTYRTLKSSRL